MKKLQIGKEYEVQGKYVKLEAFGESTAVCRDRWDNQFECDISYVKEKQIKRIKK